MLIFSVLLCILSMNYFMKTNHPGKGCVQLYLIFMNCIPRITHGFFICLIEIAAHAYFQDLARLLSTTDEVTYKLLFLEVLGFFAPTLLEFSGILQSPRFMVDFFKYTIFYFINAAYIFIPSEDPIIRLAMVGFHGLIALVFIIKYCMSTYKVRTIWDCVDKVYPMVGGGSEDASNFLIVEPFHISVSSLSPKKQVLRSFELKTRQTFIGYDVNSSMMILHDTEIKAVKGIDCLNFKEKYSTPCPSRANFIMHQSKGLLAAFSPLSESTGGTLIKIYDCASGNPILSIGLSHKITKSESLILFDSFQVDIEKHSDRIIFYYEKMLCSLDIDSKANESLSTTFEAGFSIFKANERRLILSGKEDWALMYDVPTNQPVMMNNVFLSYSRIIPIKGLSDYYLVEPSCCKKNVYLIKGYGQDMKILRSFDIGFPNIVHAVYSKTTAEILFIDRKNSKSLMSFPFSKTGRDQQKLGDFEDSIIVLD